MPRDLDRDRDLLRSLHVPGKPLVLPNAWDVASAKAVVAAGFPVVATTSAGVAEALGYGDHQAAPAEAMLAAAARIARSVDVPVTVDAEAGYGLDPPGLAEALREAGAAGCNLEDTDHATGKLGDPAEQAAWLAAVRADDESLVINARVDTGDVAEAVERGAAYVGAGADCVYPIQLADESSIEQFVGAVGAPVNVLLRPNALPLSRLAELGVARISLGPYLFRRTMEQLERLLASVR